MFLSPLDALMPKKDIFIFHFHSFFLGLWGPGVGLGGSLGAPSIEPGLGAGVRTRGLYAPPPPPHPPTANRQHA